jgi:uncharacterized protein YdhG (YjbR/CyaY superfamily)
MAANRRPQSSRKSIDAYLASLPADKRATLEKLRKDIHAAAPGAQECISYQLPAFRYGGKMLVWFGAAKDHCSFYPGGIVAAFKDDLKNYNTSKGTIRFPPDKPLPATLVRKIVKARIEIITKSKRASATRRARRR